MARPCRGAVTGCNRVGRPLKDVQARLRALRAGRHPTSGIELEVARQAPRSVPARPGHDRERSRSLRRAVACRNLIAAINGVDPDTQNGIVSSAGVGANARQRGRRSYVPTTNRAALCQLLIAASSSEGAAAYSAVQSGSDRDSFQGGIVWCAAVLLCIVCVATAHWLLNTASGLHSLRALEQLRHRDRTHSDSDGNNFVKDASEIVTAIDFGRAGTIQKPVRPC